MRTILSAITHDIRSNTLEATWLGEVTDPHGNVLGYPVVKCRNYPAEQKEEFLADVGADGQKYVVMAGW